jgi:hypothetical protein
MARLFSFGKRLARMLKPVHRRRARSTKSCQLQFEQLESRLAPTLTPIAPLPGVNADLNTFDHGSYYPHGGNLTVGSVPFTLTTDPGGSGDSFVVEDPVVFGRTDPPGGAVFDIPVGVAGLRTVYTLMDSGWGVLGQNIASVEFIGSGGGDYKQTLVEGTNIRNHSYGISSLNLCNQIAPGTPTMTFTGGGTGGPGNEVHLDTQTWPLPAAFASQTLTDIKFITYGNVPNGVPFLAALTVSTSLPGPVTWTNPSGGDWDTSGNWNTGAVPAATDDVVINNSLNAGAAITHSDRSFQQPAGDRPRSFHSEPRVSRPY